MTMFPKNMQTIRICRSSKKIYIFFNCLVSSKLNLGPFMLLEYATYPLLLARGYVDLSSFPSVIQCQRFPSALQQHFLSSFTWFSKQRPGQVLRALCPTHLYLEKCMVHRFHRMLVIGCSWASSRSALQVL